MKIALCVSDDAALAQRLASGMLDVQRPEREFEARLVPFRLGCLGLIGRPHESLSDLPIWQGTDGSFLAFAGLPITSDGDASGSIGANSPLVRRALSGSLSEHDFGDTIAALGQLDGAFVAIWWDAAREALTLVTDFLGMQPLYRLETDGATLFASEVKAFVGSGAMRAEPDAGAWGAMLFFGHQIGPRSLLAGATRVPAATALTFTASGDERSRTTWRWPTPNRVSNTEAVRDAVGDAVRSDVAAYATAYPDASLLLSGGFDSRLILCLCRDIGLRPPLIIQSHPDENADADARFAEAFARMLGLPWRRVSLAADFFGSDAYLSFLERNEIATPSYRLFIAAVATAVAPERHGVWEGLLLDPALKFEYGEGGFAPYLNARARERQAYRAAARLVFTPAWAEQVEAEYDAIVATEQVQFEDDADGVWRFSVLNRSRFRTGVNPYQVYDSVTPALTPGMSKRFWEAVSAADPQIRFGKRLYRAVFDLLAPDGLRLPVASGASLLPGHGGAALYHAQRARAAVQRTVRRPRLNRLFASAGLPVPFAWQPSRFLKIALDEASLDDARLNADWIRRQRGADGSTPSDAVALEVLMYWQGWHHAMRGNLTSAWGRGRSGSAQP